MVKRTEGYVLLVALFVIFLMMAGGTLLAGSLQYRMWLLRQEVQSVQLTALTDSGLAMALDALSLSPFYEGTEETRLGDGTVAVEVEFGEQAETRVVQVTATYDKAGRRVRAVVQLSERYPPRVLSWEPVAFVPEGSP